MIRTHLDFLEKALEDRSEPGLALYAREIAERFDKLVNDICAAAQIEGAENVVDKIEEEEDE